MNKEFHKWLDKYSEQPRGDEININDCENAWNAARDKILELLKSNLRHGYHEESGGRIGFDILEIPWPYAERVIKEIEKL